MFPPAATSLLLLLLLLLLSSLPACESFDVSRYTLTRRVRGGSSPTGGGDSVESATVYEAHDTATSRKTFSFLPSTVAGAAAPPPPPPISFTELPFTDAGVGHVGYAYAQPLAEIDPILTRRSLRSPTRTSVVASMSSILIGVSYAYTKPLNEIDLF